MTSHHAYFYEGPLSLLLALAADAKQLFNFPDEHSPDVSVQTFEAFGIDEARELAQQSSFKTVSGRSLTIIGASSITSEAQQALLKLFEEPVAGAIFILLMPHGALLPTLRSRMLVFEWERKEIAGQNSLGATRGLFGKQFAEASEQQILSFLKAPYKTRSAEIVALLKDDEGTKERAREFMNALEAALYVELQKSAEPLKKEILQGLADIATMRDYLADRAPALKMLLEHLAATLPKIS
jgi:DNA polymerase III delta prime subunit